MELGTAAQWAGAAATFVAVLVALFKDELLHSWRKPKLTVMIDLRPPDCHKTKVNYAVQKVVATYGSAGCYYLRLWVENVGKTRAERVQVFAAKLLRQNADGSFNRLDGFLPMNLTWAHAQPGRVEIFAEGISPKMGKHCDLGHLIDPRFRKDLGEDLSGVAEENTVLALELETKPNTLSHLMPPGAYRLQLRVAAGNCAPVTKTIEITLTGKWFDKEEEMFSDGLGIRIIS